MRELERRIRCLLLVLTLAASCGVSLAWIDSFRVNQDVLRELRQSASLYGADPDKPMYEDMARVRVLFVSRGNPRTAHKVYSQRGSLCWMTTTRTDDERLLSMGIVGSSARWAGFELEQWVLDQDRHIVVRSRTVPYWALLIILGSYPLCWFVLSLLRRTRGQWKRDTEGISPTPVISEDRCFSCGYALIGVTGGRCPECGELVAGLAGARPLPWEQTRMKSVASRFMRTAMLACFCPLRFLRIVGSRQDLPIRSASTLVAITWTAVLLARLCVLYSPTFLLAYGESHSVQIAWDVFRESCVVFDSGSLICHIVLPTIHELCYVGLAAAALSIASSGLAEWGSVKSCGN